MTEKLDPHPAFLAFGRLFAKVGAFEQFMRVALMEREVQSGAVAKMSEQQRRAYSNKLLRLDFAQLEQRICHQFNLSGDDKAVLKDAKSFRNDLAHNFWQSNFGNLHSKRGISLVEQQCAQLEVQFEALGEHLINLTGAKISDYVAWVQAESAKGEHLDELERLVGEGWQAHLDAGHIKPPQDQTS
jgi:DNA-binding transcriptional regulator PaaX